MIELKGVTKYFGPAMAVKEVSFSVEQGEIVGFLGPNGAGKTTTMRMITGFLPMSRGEVTVDGYSVVEQPKAVRSRIGYLPESNPLYEDLRVREYLSFRAALKGVPRSQRKDRVTEVLEDCEALEVSDRIIGTCSKGFRQRVGLADALLAAPPVLILDEPTVGLDPKQIVRTRSLIRNLAEKHTVILSTHILPEVEAICSRTLIIHQGRLRFDGSVSDLRASLTGGLHLVCEVKGSAEDAGKCLASVPGVDRVEDVPSNSGNPRFNLYSTSGEDIRERLFRACVEANLPILEITPHQISLEEAFLQITMSESAEEVEP